MFNKKYFYFLKIASLLLYACSAHVVSAVPKSQVKAALSSSPAAIDSSNQTEASLLSLPDNVPAQDLIKSNHKQRTQKKRRAINNPIYEWFDKKVDRYFVSSKELALEKFKPEQRLGNELLHAIDRIEQCSTPGQLIALLARVCAASRDDAARDDHEVRVDKDVIDQIRCALLLKISSIMCALARNVTLDVLHDIDNYLLYWDEQHNHPTRYFLHKSPLKWVTGKKQHDEVRDNIRMLKKVQAKHYHMLGTLTSHIHRFNEVVSINDRFSWLETLILIIHEFLFTQSDGDGSNINIDSFDRLANKIQQNLGQLLVHKKQVMSDTSEAKKPNHFIRHWMAYSALLTGVLFAQNYRNNNPKVIDKWVGPEAMNGYKESIIKSSKCYVVDPMKDIWNTIFNYKETDMSVVNQLEGKVSKLNETLSSSMDETEKKEKITSEHSEIALKEIEKVLNELTKDGYFSNTLKKDEAESILEAAKNNDVGPFIELVCRMPKSLYSLTIDSNNLKAFWALLMFLIFNNGEGILLDAKKLINIALESLTNGNVAMHEVLKALFDAKKENQLTLKFMALVPTFWVVTNVPRKIYNWWTKRDYASIRHSLAHINSILIESANNFDNVAYGKLIYLLHQLKCKAKRHVPSKDNMRQEFFQDIVKLESDDFTIEEKRAMIDNMRAYYSFLANVS